MFKFFVDWFNKKPDPRAEAPAAEAPYKVEAPVQVAPTTAPAPVAEESTPKKKRTFVKRADGDAKAKVAKIKAPAKPKAPKKPKAK